MNKVRLLTRKDIEAYVRLIKLGYLEVEAEGIHYGTYLKSREDLMRWLIKVPTWGLFNDKGLLIASLSIQFGWNRKDNKNGIIVLKHGVVLSGFKGCGYFSFLFSWIETNIIKRILRANSLYLETNRCFLKFRDLYLKKFGFYIAKEFKENVVVLRKDYTYKYVSKALSFDDTFKFCDLSIRMLTENDSEQYYNVLREGSKSSLSEGIDYSFGHFSKEKCYEELIKLPTWGIFGNNGQLVAVASIEFPWQLTCSNKKRRHVFLRQAAVLKSFYKYLIRTQRMSKYKDNYTYRLFRKNVKFSFYSMLTDYLMSHYLIEMFKCTVIFTDTAYGSQAMNTQVRDWDMEIVEHIYTYRSTSHAVVLRRKFVYE